MASELADRSSLKKYLQHLEMAWQLIALVDFAGTQVQLPALVSYLTIVCNPSSQAFGTV